MNYPTKANYQIQRTTPQIRYWLIPVFNKLIDAFEKGEILTRDGKRYEQGTIKGYKNTRDILQEYQDKYGRILLDDITEDWVSFLVSFLATEKNHSKATIGNHLARVKAVVNRAYRACITRRNGACIILQKEYTYKVYCNLEDLRKISEATFTRKSFYKIRDLFILNCFIAMRVGDFWKFIENPKKHIITENGRQFINYFSKKKNKKTVVPISNIANKILERYNYNFGKPFSIQYYALCLKEIAKQSGITEEIHYIQTLGGVVQEITKPKWKMISPHTARRTFASLAELYEIPKASIMKMTGHTTEQSFNCYVRISELENALRIQEHDFFKIEI